MQPGKPDQNAYIERFIHTFREDILDAYLFKTISDVKSVTFEWMKTYNSQRPHEPRNNLSPQAFVNSIVHGLETLLINGPVFGPLTTEKFEPSKLF
ncbi:MAG: transposase [Anaerolineaceae bacterium]|nr:transposase [Anaerolineaceae bacterium]